MLKEVKINKKKNDINDNDIVSLLKHFYRRSSFTTKDTMGANSSKKCTNCAENLKFENYLNYNKMTPLENAASTINDYNKRYKEDVT